MFTIKCSNAECRRSFTVHVTPKGVSTSIGAKALLRNEEQDKGPLYLKGLALKYTDETLLHIVSLQEQHDAALYENDREQTRQLRLFVDRIIAARRKDALAKEQVAKVKDEKSKKVVTSNSKSLAADTAEAIIMDDESMGHVDSGTRLNWLRLIRLGRFAEIKKEYEASLEGVAE
jgi:hypothetical protein